ncbi:thioesterase domain-containing protein [Paenibacillus sp. GbtcB18]|uniref:thioesterase II family protein n=1 Tax=Paenibacillus sp. GbtcB18 TaxID=2824763 RepID=UPI001C30CF3A|nr:thioesterase domain-containing protein [Paenibacillus sp. GbtcB18]
MILFCLPYAGGSEAIYCHWNKFLDSSVVLEPIPLKGRGKRIKEEFYDSIEEAVEDIFEQLKEKIGNTEYAIFGHSMGAILAYELYYKIKQENLRLPDHIFFSGHRPPNMPRREEPIHLLPDDDFIKEVIALGGTPQNIAVHKELLQMFTPILRSDFKMLETYHYRKKKEKIQCEISVLNGKEDDITSEELIAWRHHTDMSFHVYPFTGSHFFIHHNIEQITKLINHILLSKVTKAKI